jgi:hypothetical protein
MFAEASILCDDEKRFIENAGVAVNLCNREAQVFTRSNSGIESELPGAKIDGHH